MPASLLLSLTNAADADLNDSVTVELFSLQTSARLQASANVQRNMLIEGIDPAAGSVYRVVVTPANHRIVEFFVPFNGEQQTRFSAIVPVDPAKVVNISAPQFTALASKMQQLLEAAQVPRFNDGSGGYLRGSKLYSAWDPLPLLKACFLNIATKSAATLLPDGSNCLDHFSSLVRIEQDRLFIKTTAALLEEASHSNLFHPVTDLLHTPLPGYQLGPSFKTFDHYGNLQLTFQRGGASGDDYAVDVDIDDAQGIEHIFQVIRNTLTGPTNPYDIHDILLRQTPRVDPGYEFVFAAVAPARAV